MKYKINYFFILIFILSSSIKTQEDVADHIITFFIHQYPKAQYFNIDKDDSTELCNIINCTSLTIPSNVAIFATYSGYMTLSNESGQITFPRKTVQDSFNLLIAEKISPVFMFRNTIAFWKIREGSHAKMYRLEKKQDKDTQIFYWDVKEKQIPDSKKIPLHTIIVIAEPKHIYVPTGITPTTNNPQLVLPAIYAKSNLKHIQNSFFILNIKPFYSQIKHLYKERPLGYIMQIT